LHHCSVVFYATSHLANIRDHECHRPERPSFCLGTITNDNYNETRSLCMSLIESIKRFSNVKEKK